MSIDSPRLLSTDKLQLEHVFSFGTTKAWDKTVRKLVDECVLGFTVLSFGVAAYLLLRGVAEVVTAIKGSINNQKDKMKKERGNK
jgi:hypothetical protein